MTRKSRREIERDLEDLNDEQAELGRPFSEGEQAMLEETGVDVGAWCASATRRAMLRSLLAASRRAES